MAKFSRITVLAAVAGALFVGQVGAASAFVKSGESDTKVVAASTSTADCVGKNAVTNIVYKVNGKVVPRLRGQAAQGATVTVDFKVKSNCNNAKLGLAAYEAPSPAWVREEAKFQKLVASDSATLAANATKSFSVKLPSCYYQVDFFTGVPVAQLDERGGYFNGNLIDADNGGKNVCAKTPPTTVPPTTVPPTTVPPTVKECPTSDKARITSYSYTINGKADIKDLEGKVISGKKVKVDFTIAEKCANQEVSLVSYEAPSNDFSVDNIHKQVLFDSATGKFNEGKHTLEIDVPECFFQVDFVRGPVLKNLGPKGTDNFYGSRLIDTDKGGVECEVAPPTTVTTVKPTTTTTAKPTTTTVAPTTTTVETEVLGEVIEKKDEPKAEVKGEELAKTGLETLPLAMIGGGLTLGGLALQGLSARLRQNKKN